jgi:hypothetical protein
MQRRTRESLKTLLLVAFLAGGLLLVRAGALPAWVWVLLTLVTMAMRLLARLDAYRDELFVTDAGITRRHGSRVRKTAEEAVRWDELEKVEVLTQEAGPDGADLLFLLHGRGTNGVAVSGALAQQHGLPALLQQRLPGFREDQLAQAQAATGKAAFLLWERQSALS